MYNLKYTKQFEKGLKKLSKVETLGSESFLSIFTNKKGAGFP